MFKKLRNKLILMNLGITTVVVMVVFAVIYVTATGSAEQRPPIPENVRVATSTFNGEVERIVTFTVREEKQAAAQNLLVTLIASGVAIEVAVLIVSYMMAEAAVRPVREAYNAQKTFIANASHEIKTPLAAIAANLEAAELSDNRWIANVERETEKLTQLNTELLTLARTDLIDSEKAELEEVELAGVVRRTVESFEPRAQQKGAQISYSVKGAEAKVWLRRADYEQVLGILLDNAVKYCERRVRVGLSGRRLVVANDGAILTSEQAGRVFERFYQVDKSAEGVGLGLSIAQGVAERNGWKLTVEGGEETRFAVEV